MKKLYYNSGYFFLVLFAFVLGGFYTTYFGLMPKFDKTTTWLVHVHATLLICWVILLVVQPLLIRYKKTKLHKAIGKFTYVLVPLIICSMVGMALKQLSEVPGKLTPWTAFLNIKLAAFDGLMFITFYTLAIINRKNFQKHGAFMIATGIIFINPSLSRLLFYLAHMSFLASETVAIAFGDLLVLAMLLYFRRKKLSTKPYAFVLAILLTCHIITTSLIICGL